MDLAPAGIGVDLRAVERHRAQLEHPYLARQCRHLRLSRARRALLSARGRSVTVSKIATRLGFFELGRFSVEYRKLFGESPSETLRKAVREHERRRSALVKRMINR